MARVSIKSARVSIWNVRLPCQNATSWVDWVGMTMEWESGGPNLFHLSAKRCVRLRRPQGCDGALMRDLTELGKLSRADLVRLQRPRQARALHGLPLDNGLWCGRSFRRRPGRHPSLTATPSPLRNRRQLPASPRHKRRGR